MRKLKILILVFILLPYAAQAVELVWPPPPERTRLQFVRSVSRAADLGVKKSFLKKVWEFVAGEEPEGLVRPYGIAVMDNRVFITDMALSTFHIFDLLKNDYRIVTPKPTRLPSPVAIAFIRSGEALIVDSVLKKIFVYNAKGDYTGEFAPGFPFQRPTAIAVSPRDNAVWVTDTLAHQVLKFSPTGERLLTLGKRGAKKGEFNFPTGLTAGKDGRLYVCDTLNARIQIFSAEGKFLSTFGRLGDSTGDFSTPKSVALDSEGNIYVVDGLFDAVQIFNEKGHLLLVFGQRGNRKGEFYVPAAVVIDGRDRIFVTDSYNGRLQIFQYLRES